MKRRMTLMVVGWLLGMLVGGCARQAMITPLTVADPVRPRVHQEGHEADMGMNCSDPRENAQAKRKVADLVLAYVNTGRDFHEPVGLDGYVLRVIPLDGQFRTVPVPGEVVIRLYPVIRRQGGILDSRPLRVWRISAEELEHYWFPTRLLDGYLFRLDWGPAALPMGSYQFWVTLNYIDDGEDVQLCQELAFEDVLRRDEAKLSLDEQEAGKGETMD